MSTQVPVKVTITTTRKAGFLRGARYDCLLEHPAGFLRLRGQSEQERVQLLADLAKLEPTPEIKER